MQQMHHATKFSKADDTEALSAEVMEVAPLVMRAIRALVRRRRGAGLSVPQFRALGYVRRNPGCSLSAVAEHLGLSAPATSRMIDTLADGGYVVRESPPGDRRFVALRLSELGEHVQAEARALAMRQVQKRLEMLSAEQRALIAQAMEPLRLAFTEAIDDTTNPARPEPPA